MWKRKLIKKGYAEYNKKTARWEWKRGQWLNINNIGKCQFKEVCKDGSIIVLVDGERKVINGRDIHPLEKYLDGPKIDKLIKLFYERGDNTRGFKSFLWSTIIRDRANRSCDLCGSKESIQVHHLYGYQEFHDKRLDVLNGICLCESCHIGYHEARGYDNNTKEDFESYLHEKSKNFEKEAKRLSESIKLMQKSESKMRILIKGINSHLCIATK
jgi:hypothetical protein